MPISSLKPVRLALLVLALAAAGALAACGDDGDDVGDLGPDPATLAPSDAPVYFEAVVRPEGDQKDDLHEALAKLLNTDDPGARIRDLVESGLQEEGASYSEDIEPWLGQRVGGFVTGVSGEDVEGAVAVAVTDQEEAQGAVDRAIEGDAEEAEYEGVSYTLEDGGASATGFVEDFLVIGTEQGFKSAVDVSAGESLADNEEATDALDSSLEDSLFRVYADAAALVDLAVESGEVSRRDLGALGGQLDALEDGPVVVSGAATPDAMSIEFSGPAGADEEQTAIVSDLPAGAWLAFGVPDVGERVAAGYQGLIESVQSSLGELGEDLPDRQIPDIQQELGDQLGIDLTQDLQWAGDTGTFIQGGSLFDLGGGVVIETDDEQAAARTLDRLARALGRERSLDVSATEDGFELQAQGAPLGAEAGIRDGKVVFGFGGASIDDVLSPPQTLADSENFSAASDALGEGLEAALFVDFSQIVSLVDSTGQTDPSFEQARPVLEALDYLVAGGGSEGDRSIGRLVLGVQEAESGEGQAAAIVP